MSSVNISYLAMRKLADTWFIEHIPNRMFVELQGAATVLWNALLSCPNEGGAVEAFLDYFGGNPEAKQDVPFLLNMLRQQNLIGTTQDSLSVPSAPESVCNSHDNTSADIQEHMCHTANILRCPIVADYEMTYRCNFRCVYCYQPIHLKQDHFNELTQQDIAAMIEDFANSGVFFLSITGGECTLSPNFSYVIQCARINFMDVTVLTNGMAFTPAMIEFLAEQHVSEVIVSIYGSSAGEYECFTRSSSAFPLVINNIIRLRDAGVRVIAKVIVTSAQEKTFHETLAMLTDLGVMTKVSYYITPAMNGDHYPFEYKVPTERLAELRRAGLIHKIGKRACTAGSLKFRVNPEGLVTVCELERTPLGNVREQKILTILTSEKTQAVKATLSKASAYVAGNPEIGLPPCPALSKIESPEGSYEAQSPC